MICDWSHDNRVQLSSIADQCTTLYLDQNELTQLPDSVALFQRLTKLSCYDNALTELPECLLTMRHL